MPDDDATGLTVAVTGPTGDIGRSLLRALEHSDEVGRVLAMARRPFDPGAENLRKTEYRQGDVLDRDAVDHLVAGADVVVHLAFVIMGARDETESVNLKGAEVFDPVKMGELYEIGYRTARAGPEWEVRPPGFQEVQPPP